MSTNEVNSEYKVFNEHHEYRHVPAFNDHTKIVIVITGLVLGNAAVCLGLEVGTRVGRRVFHEFFNLAYCYKTEYRRIETPEQEDDQSGTFDSSEE